MEIHEINTLNIDNYKLDITSLLRQSFIKSYPRLNSSHVQFIERYNKLKDYLEQNAKVYGCFDSGALIGFIWFFEKREMGLRLVHLNQIVVNDNYRKQGLGTKLLHKMEEYCIKNKIDEIELIVTNSNEHAVKFYKNKSFHTERLLMRKKI